MAKLGKSVYDADGVPFNIYETIKSTKSGPTRYWLLEDYSTGKRRLLNNKTQKAARERADKIRDAMVKGQASRMTLSNGQWQEVCIALEIVRSVPTADSLSSAVRMWARCIGMLDGRASLVDAVRFYLANHKGSGPPMRPTRFTDAAPLYHQSKVQAGKSKSHCDNIDSRLGRVETALTVGSRLDELTAGELEAAVLSLGLAPKTRNEYRILLSNFFKWAGKQNPPMVPKGFNPAKEMEHYHVAHDEVEFLHVADLHKILTGAQTKRPDLLLLIALVCFAGLRPSEAARLDWAEIGEDYIRLPGKKSKTGHNRQIPIQQNLKSWLALQQPQTGLVCPGVSLEHINKAILRFSGVRVPHDAMRHGYGTHRQMVVKHVGMVAEEMGNSVGVCRRHYLNAFCTEQEAADWFGIMPEMPTNVINLDEAAPAVTAAAAIT